VIYKSKLKDNSMIMSNSIQLLGTANGLSGRDSHVNI